MKGGSPGNGEEQDSFLKMELKSSLEPEISMYMEYDALEKTDMPPAKPTTHSSHFNAKMKL